MEKWKTIMEYLEEGGTVELDNFTYVLENGILCFLLNNGKTIFPMETIIGFNDFIRNCESLHDDYITEKRAYLNRIQRDESCILKILK